MKKKQDIIKVKAYCIVVTRKRDCNPDFHGIKLDLMGTNENPYLSVHPKNQKGQIFAKENCNGYEKAIECEIIIPKHPKHKCNCEFCDIL